MSNLETAPAERLCHFGGQLQPLARLLETRAVPLGGVRGMTVTRALPQRGLPMIGAWCFLDQMGPERVDMRVLPHPHIGLQTVTWPLVGQVRHRDSVGSDVVISPGQLNLMTSGAGVAHSEISLGDAPLLHALQLWVGLPADRAAGEADFRQYADLPRYEQSELSATVFVGEMGEARSPAEVYTGLLGADVTVDAGADQTLPLRPDFEHAALVLDGHARIAGVEVGTGPLLYLGAGRDELPISTDPSSGGARILLLGGEPFPDALVMWWNFVGRSHDEIVTAREQWESHSTRFPQVVRHGSERIPAPPLPGVRLSPRRRTL